MAENAPEQQDRGLFGIFGKKDEHQQAPHENVAHHGNAPVPTAPYHHESGPAAASVNTTEHIHSAHEEPLKHGHGHEGGDGGGLMSKIKEKLPGQETGPAGVPVNTTEHICSVHEEPPKHGLGGGGIMNKLHRNDSSSSSSSDEEGEYGKKKKKNGMMGKIKEKLPGGEKTEEQHRKNEEKNDHAGEGEKKEGFVDKVKDKLPGFKKEGEH